MKWIEKNAESYYPIYKCSNCGTEIMVAEACDLPCYCKKCGADMRKEDEGK
jgi:transcription initiation factor IIE alpha subunit